MKNHFSYNQKLKNKSQLKKKEKHKEQKTEPKNGIFFTAKTQKTKSMIQREAK